jgi:hypothetical protein
MKALNKDQIIAKFKKSFITIKESDCKKSNKGMIVTIHQDCTIKFFPTYYTAYCFYSSIGLI